MANKLKIVAMASVLSLFVASSCTKNYDDLDVRVSNLEIDIQQRINDFTDVLNELVGVDSTLQAYISNLEIDITNLEDYLNVYIKKSADEYDSLLVEIQNLKDEDILLHAKDEYLQRQIDSINLCIGNLRTELIDYIDNSVAQINQETINELMAWADTTFVHYLEFNELKNEVNSIQGDVTSIKSDITTIYNQLTNIDSKFIAIDSSIYYLDQKIKQIIEQNNNSTNEIRNEIINLGDTINEVQGDLIEQINDLSTKVTNLQNNYTTLNNTVNNISNKCDDFDTRINNLYNTLLTSVNSIAVVPQYKDGSIKATMAGKCDLEFVVTPTSASDSIIKWWNICTSDKKKDVLWFEETLTKSVSSAKLSAEPAMSIVDKNKGRIKLTNICIDNLTDNTCASLHISSGSTDVASSYFSFTFPIVLLGEFTVSATGRKVRFTSGNLYRDGETFKIESTQTNNHYPDCIKYSDAYPEYLHGDCLFRNISVGGFNGLYLLTEEEWQYLMNGRNGGQSDCNFIVKESDDYPGFGTHQGLFILPDGSQSTILDECDTWDDVYDKGIVFIPRKTDAGDDWMMTSTWQSGSNENASTIVFDQGDGKFKCMFQSSNIWDPVRLVKYIN